MRYRPLIDATTHRVPGRWIAALSSLALCVASLVGSSESVAQEALQVIDGRGGGKIVSLRQACVKF